MAAIPAKLARCSYGALSYAPEEAGVHHVPSSAFPLPLPFTFCIWCLSVDDEPLASE